MQDIMARITGAMDEAMGEQHLHQNRGKQVVQPIFTGKGAQLDTRYVFGNAYRKPVHECFAPVAGTISDTHYIVLFSCVTGYAVKLYTFNIYINI